MKFNQDQTEPLNFHIGDELLTLYSRDMYWRSSLLSLGG